MHPWTHLRHLALVAALYLACIALTTHTLAATSPTTTAPTPNSPPSAADLATYTAYAARLKDDEIPGRLALAHFAFDHRLYAQAQEMARQTLYRDPGNLKAYDILRQVETANPLPPEPEATQALLDEMQKHFGHPFKFGLSPHFLICYDTSPPYARQRAEVLEETYDAMQRFFILKALRPTLLEHRLVVLLFKERADYLAYAKAYVAVDFSWSAGFYSQISNRSAFYDDSTGPFAADLGKRTDDLRARIRDLGSRIDGATAQHDEALATSLSGERFDLREQLAQSELFQASAIQVLNNTKTYHEAAHQIAFNTGIQKRLVDYPRWLAEGLACSFEFQDPFGRRGPLAVNFLRIDGIHRALKTGKFLPLEQFIEQDRPAKMEDEDITLYYAEAWGVFHYLYKYERTGLEAYLAGFVARQPLQVIPANQRRKGFTDAFGDRFPELDKKLIAYMKLLPDRPN